MQGKKGTTRFIELKCCNCNASIQKRESEYNSSIRRGQTEFYCNLTCAGQCFGAKIRRTEMLELVCAGCSKPFQRSSAIYNWHTARGQTRFYCNALCAIHEATITPRKPDPNASLFPFGYFMGTCAQRKKKAVDLDFDRTYLFELWQAQNGTCPLTGWKLILPRSHSFGFENGHNMRNASLDRIDNDKGYVRGNVRFVAVAANLGKRSYSDDEFLRMCRAVAENMAPLAQKLKVA